MIDFRHRFLFRSPMVWIVDIRWRSHDPRPTREVDSPMPEVTFMRSGMFVHRRGRRGTSCDPNTLLFLNVDEPYRMTHPIDTECACTALHISPAALRDIVAAHDPAAVDRDSRIFSVGSGPCAPEATVDHCSLLHRLREPGSTEPGLTDALEIEEAGLALARDAVAAAYRFHDRPRRRRRPSTEKAHADVAEATREVLAARFRERLSLEDIAATVHVAPNHLCTVFRQRTGFTIHEYLTRLRLAAAIDVLLDGPCRLADLALDLGFADQSHFATAFRRVYGRPPSRLLPPSVARRMTGEYEGY